jgi:hypothetical protein
MSSGVNTNEKILGIVINLLQRGLACSNHGIAGTGNRASQESIANFYYSRKMEVLVILDRADWYKLYLFVPMSFTLHIPHDPFTACVT